MCSGWSIRALSGERRSLLKPDVVLRSYKSYRSLLCSARWQRAYNFGARAQRLLWASTGTKDPKLTIWHTEIPPSLQHMGIGGRLVEESVQLASRDSSRLRIVCPFAKEYLARHPELKERYAVRLEEASPVRGLHPNL